MSNVVAQARAESGRPGGDRVSLQGIRGFGYHGFFDFEKAQGQEFVVDVTCYLDLAPAATADDLSLTVDYGELATAVHADIAGPGLNLIEALADRIATTCLRTPGVAHVEVTVHKPQAPMPVTVADVAVTVSRTRSGPTHDNQGGTI